MYPLFVISEPTILTLFPGELSLDRFFQAYFVAPSKSWQDWFEHSNSDLVDKVSFFDGSRNLRMESPLFNGKGKDEEGR